jgi:hypothetical protein
MECPQSVQKSSSMICGPFLLFKSRDNKYTLTNSMDISHKTFGLVRSCVIIKDYKPITKNYKPLLPPTQKKNKKKKKIYIYIMKKKNYFPKTLWFKWFIKFGEIQNRNGEIFRVAYM